VDKMVDYLIVPFDEDVNAVALVISKILDNKNVSNQIYERGSESVKKAFSYADKKNIAFVIFIAPDEWKENKIIIKNLKESSQNITTITDFIATFP
jgi:histidyl-tRNA synthetase